MAATNEYVDTNFLIETSKPRDQQQKKSTPSMAQHQYELGGKSKSAAKYHSTSALANPSSTTDQISPLQSLIVYGELSILGYNGYIPNTERNGRRNKSKFLLCKRPVPNGIKKSRHYNVKQPQATKAIQDKDLHSISYTFSRSQTIIVEYRQDENTDMFQIGRSSEDPIDFVVMDTLASGFEPTQTSHSHKHHHHHYQQQQHYSNENSSGSNQQQMSISNDLAGISSRFHRHLAKVGGEMIHCQPPPSAHDPRNRLHYQRPHHQGSAVLLNYPQPNMSNLPPMMADHFRNQDPAIYGHHHESRHPLNQHGHPSGSHQIQPPQQMHGDIHNLNNVNGRQEQYNANNRPTNNVMCKRSHATQSTISRFACRILVDRHPPYTARIYAAGFDSSRNIFLGEKATKWEQDNSIDGLTTNGVLLMHPKREDPFEHSTGDGSDESHHDNRETIGQTKLNYVLDSSSANNQININNSGDNNSSNSNNDRNSHLEQICSNKELENNDESPDIGYPDLSPVNNSINVDGSEQAKRQEGETSATTSNDLNNNSNNNNEIKSRASKNVANGTQSDRKVQRRDHNSPVGGVWREVSVDGGIYAIRESRSAAQKGTRIEEENNILQDGTLIDLCGATLLWRSVDGFKASPTKKTLEEKIDLLNASRPQCPVGLNTLVIPRKPILPTNHRHHHRKHHDGSHSHSSNNKDPDKINSHQPYVYLKCGHVQGYHDWGATDHSNLRTCPICLSVGAVAKLSMGLEPSFYVDSGPLSHVFSPCGHMASERTVRYWCSIKIPHGTHFFHAICPFCATPLAINEPASTRLIFQDDLD